MAWFRRTGKDGAEGEASAQPSVAVVTMVQNEAGMLPRWLDYYGGLFGHENLVVLDDSTTDGSTDALPCTHYRIPPEPWKAGWAVTRNQLANGIAQGLLACNDFVVFTDVDEFLLPDPDRYDDLGAYLAAKAGADVIAPVALNVLHNPEVEGPLDPARPLLAQRRFVKFAQPMCKPQIKSIPAPWLQGFHGIKAPFEIDPDLWMLHLKYYDVESLQVVAEARRRANEAGRGGAASAWTMGAAELTDQLREWVAVPPGETVPDFDPAEVPLADVVDARPNGAHRSRGSQMASMEQNPLRQVPERFHHLL